MSSAMRNAVSRILKPAAAAAVLGIAGFVMAPSAKASMITFELVPTSASSGTVSGQAVNLTGPGTVNFNVVAVLHNGTDTAADVGLQGAGLSILSDSGGSLGTLAMQVPASGPFLNPVNYVGTPSGTPVGTNVGPDQVGVQNADSTDQFIVGTSSGNSVDAAPNASGDLTQIFGTGTYTVTASSGSTTVIPVIHLDSRTFGGGRLMYHFDWQGHFFQLNGTGAGTEDSVALAQPISNPFDTQGFSVAIQPVPEPGSLALAGLGGLGLLLRRRRK